MTVTPEELRQALADQDVRMRRLLGDGLQPLKDQAQRIEAKVDATNERVSHLERWRIHTEASAGARAEAAKVAADLVAHNAELALKEKEHSWQWRVGAVTAATAAVGAVTTLSSLVASYLH